MGVVVEDSVRRFAAGSLGNYSGAFGKRMAKSAERRASLRFTRAGLPTGTRYRAERHFTSASNCRHALGTLQSMRRDALLSRLCAAVGVRAALSLCGGGNGRRLRGGGVGVAMDIQPRRVGGGKD